MASDFLDNLKRAVDNGEFNSEAARKINEIDNLTSKKVSQLADGETIENSDISKSINERLEKAGVKTVGEEEVAIINSDFDKKMLEIKEKDLALQQVKTLIEIDDLVMLSVYDMKDFIQTITDSFDKNKPSNSELFNEVEKIKIKYSSIINF